MLVVVDSLKVVQVSLLVAETILCDEDFNAPVLISCPV